MIGLFFVCLFFLHVFVLLFKVLHQALHVIQFTFQVLFFIAQAMQVSAQFSDVVLEHGIDFSVGGGLFLQNSPLGLQPFVLLLQKAHLRWDIKHLNEHLFIHHCNS